MGMTKMTKASDAKSSVISLVAHDVLQSIINLSAYMSTE